jgi:hypothetical protein
MVVAHPSHSTRRVAVNMATLASASAPSRCPASGCARPRLNRRLVDPIYLRSEQREATRANAPRSARLVARSSSATVEATGVNRDGGEGSAESKASVHVLALVPGEGTNSSRLSPFQAPTHQTTVLCT